MQDNFRTDEHSFMSQIHKNRINESANPTKSARKNLSESNEIHESVYGLVKLYQVNASRMNPDHKQGIGLTLNALKGILSPAEIDFIEKSTQIALGK